MFSTIFLNDTYDIGGAELINANCIFLNMEDKHGVESKTLCKSTIDEVFRNLKNVGYIYPRTDRTMHAVTHKIYLNAIEKKFQNVNSIRTKIGKFWYINGKESNLIKDFFPNMTEINDPERILSFFKKSSADPFKVNHLFEILNYKRYLSLEDIMNLLQCTKPMACIYAKIMNELSNSLDYEIIKNKKYLFKKEAKEDLILLNKTDYLENINISELLFQFRKFLRFSIKDFSTLLEIDVNTYPHYEKGRHNSPKEIIDKLFSVIKEINMYGKRKAIFNSRKRINLNDELLNLRGMRINLDISTKELTKLMGNESDNLNNLERGFISNSSKYRRSIIQMLKQTAHNKKVPWKRLSKEIEAFKEFQKQRWKTASQYEKIVDLRIPNGIGIKFEKSILSSIEQQGFFDDVIQNVTLSDEEYKIRIETDIYAVKKFPNGSIYDVILECKSRATRTSKIKGLLRCARELKTVKEILDVKEAIIVTDFRYSKDLERNINSLGIKILNKDNLRGFFNGI